LDGSRRHESRKPHHYHLLTTRSRRSGRVPLAPQSPPTAVFTPKHQSIIQTKVVVLIALLAAARKFIILDIRDATTGYLLGLAAITLTLGATHRLMRERSDP